VTRKATSTRRPNARNDKGEGVMAVHKRTDARVQFARTLPGKSC
jgi:hypothetical protein